MVIEVEIEDALGIAKDIHPLGAKPVLEKGQQSTKYDEWVKVDETLKRYKITSLRCDSSIIIQNKNHLFFHVGKKYKANLLEDNTIQII